MRLSYNAKRGELFINNGALTHILGPNGMSSLTAAIEDVAYVSGTQLVHSTAAISQADALFSTNVLTMGATTQKQLSGVYMDIVTPNAVYVSVDYRVLRSSGFTTTSWVAFDTASSYLNLSRLQGVEFIINIKVEAFTTLFIRDLAVRYSHLDSGFLPKGVKGQ